MKGVVVTEPGTTEVKDLRIPDYNEYQALVEIQSCGLCNSTDLEVLHGEFPGFEELPTVLGHETVARVVETGDKVQRFEVGDLILRPTLEKPVEEELHSTWGGFSQYGTATDWKALQEDGVTEDDPEFDIFLYTLQTIPASFDAHEATMMVTLKEVFSALKHTGVHAGSQVLVIGDGPVGLSHVRFARHLGAETIVQVGHHDHRLEVGQTLGADISLNSSDTHVTGVLEQNDLDGRRFDYVIDAVGSESIVNEALGFIDMGAVILVYGVLVEDGLNLDLSEAPFNWRLETIQWPYFTEEASIHDEVVGLIESGDLDLTNFVSHVLPLEDFERGLDLIQSREGLKVAVDMQS